MDKVMTLPEAAAALGKSYNQTMRLVFIRELRGEQRQGRWFVDARDVARLRQRDRAPELATA